MRKKGRLKTDLATMLGNNFPILTLYMRHICVLRLTFPSGRILAILRDGLFLHGMRAVIEALRVVQRCVAAHRARKACGNAGDRGLVVLSAVAPFIYTLF